MHPLILAELLVASNELARRKLLAENKRTIWQPK
jgi:hypothetical protein